MICYIILAAKIFNTFRNNKRPANCCQQLFQKKLIFFEKAVNRKTSTANRPPRRSRHKTDGRI